MAAGGKAGKDATAKLRKIAAAETERVNTEIQDREADEAKAVEPASPSSAPASTRPSRPSASKLADAAQGHKDDIRSRGTRSRASSRC